MSTKLELPDGEYALLKDVNDITERERRPMRKRFHEFLRSRETESGPVGAVAVTGAIHPMAGGAPPVAAPEPEVSPEVEQEAEDFDLAVTAFFIIEWSYAKEITNDSLLDLPTVSFQTIDREAFARWKELFPANYPKEDSSDSTTT